jgi:regulator of protease activity HflC (stomatin/prohibitin superfamily)
MVDAQVYYKIKEDETSLKNSQYKVNDVNYQIVQLARTTLRDIIGRKDFKEVNSNRQNLNELIFETINQETADWGLEIVRCELKEIEPPDDVQATMNEENTKQAAKDFANAREIEADGLRRASIKEAEGVKEAQILRAQGQAQAIREVADARAKEIEVVNKSAQEYFKDQAVELKTLEVTEESLKENTKYIISEQGHNPTLVLSEEKGKIIPLKKGATTGKDSSGQPIE